MGGFLHALRLSDCRRRTLTMTSGPHKGQIIVAVLGFAGVVSTEQGARRGENLKVRVLSTRAS